LRTVVFEPQTVGLSARLKMPVLTPHLPTHLISEENTALVTENVNARKALRVGTSNPPRTSDAHGELLKPTLRINTFVPRASPATTKRAGGLMIFVRNDFMPEAWHTDPPRTGHALHAH
jgi:hypothetical protein